MASGICQRIMENLTTAVVVLDAELRIIWFNPAAEMLFELSARRVNGMPFVRLIPEAPVLAEGLRSALDNAHPYTERELRLNLSFGHEVTVDVTVVPLLERGATEGRELLVELAQVDRQLRISREEHLLAQHQATRALVRGLAHEIKNPLGGVRGAAQLLERELDDDGLKEYTRVIIGEADRLQNLLNRMLGPNALPQMRALNVHEVLEHVRSLVAAEAVGAVRLVTDYDPSIPELEADSELLIQAVLNIVRNAMQALGEAGGEIKLRSRTLRQFTISHKRHKLVARIDIIDNGPGIPPALMENIFFPMVTGRADGTGLGLSIAQSLINQHGGLIECSSQPGQTVFSILLPIERV